MNKGTLAIFSSSDDSLGKRASPAPSNNSENFCAAIDAQQLLDSIPISLFSSLIKWNESSAFFPLVVYETFSVMAKKLENSND